MQDGARCRGGAGHYDQRPRHFEAPAPEAWNAYHAIRPGTWEYFRQNVVGGPGAFVVAAEDFNSFGQAIVKKLIAEIALLEPQHARASWWSLPPKFASMTVALLVGKYKC